MQLILLPEAITRPVRFIWVTAKLSPLTGRIRDVIQGKMTAIENAAFEGYTTPGASNPAEASLKHCSSLYIF